MISVHQESGDLPVRMLLNCVASAQKMEPWFHPGIYPVPSNWGSLSSQVGEHQNFPKCHQHKDLSILQTFFS